MSLKQRLEKIDSPFRVAIVGIGSIGKGLAYQTHLTPGFEPVALVDIKLEKAIEFAKVLERPYRVVESESDFDTAIEAGLIAVAQDGMLPARSENVDVLISGSSAVFETALIAKTALEHNQHVVMMTFETELMYGPLLAKVANDNGKVYTCADGDQPTVIQRMLNDIEFWGFEPVMMGNIKGFLDRYTDPTKIAPEADKRGLDHKMCSSYADGSKLCVEMATIANAVDGRTHCPGMLGPRVSDIHDVFEQFDLDAIWQPGQRPLVDYVLGGKPQGGVFVIAHTGDSFQQHYLSWLPPNMGPGPFYLFYRPYHLCHFEALNCVAEACLDGTALMQARYGMPTNVTCYAKRDLAAGDTLDGMGGYNTYGLIENQGDNTDEGMPQLLCNGIRTKRPIAKDERITLADCEVDWSEPRFALYRESLSVDAIKA